MLVKHNNSNIKDNFCEYCLKTANNKIKESPLHCLFDCPKVKGIYECVVSSLKLGNLVSIPVTPKCVIIWDENTNTQKLVNSMRT